jgi:hypothetical protein
MKIETALDNITLFSSIIGNVLVVSQEVPSTHGIVEFVGEGHENFDWEVGCHYQLSVPEWDDSQVFGAEDILENQGCKGEVHFKRIGDWGNISLFKN